MSWFCLLASKHWLDCTVYTVTTYYKVKVNKTSSVSESVYLVSTWDEQNHKANGTHNGEQT